MLKFRKIQAIFLLDVFCKGIMVNQISPQTRRLSILYTNDFHGNTDNFSGLMLASKQFDAQAQPNVDTIKISAGDNYAGADTQKNSFCCRF
jgi:2',3'-cyclic-nucleotide 2'-phosphodiesterase (5'-nucleotidase family)